MGSKGVSPSAEPSAPNIAQKAREVAPCKEVVQPIRKTEIYRGYRILRTCRRTQIPCAITNVQIEKAGKHRINYCISAEPVTICDIF